MKTYRRNVGNTSVNMLEAGEGEALCLWFPNLGGTASEFGRLLLHQAHIMKGLARVAAVDPPGYGASASEPGKRPSFAELACWTKNLLQQFTEPLILGGNCSGCILPMAGASSCPNLKGMILMSWPDWRLCGEPPLFISRNKEEMRESISKTWHKLPRDWENKVERMLAVNRDPDFIEHRASFDYQQYGRDLDACPCPLFFISGKSDGFVLPDFVERTARAVSAMGMVTLAEAAHNPHQEQPKTLALTLEAPIRAFLK